MESPIAPIPLLEQHRHGASPSRCRQLAIACCHRIWEHLAPELRSAVDIAEKFLRGEAGDELRAAKYQQVNQLCIYVDGDSSPEDRFTGFSAEAVLNCLFGENDYPSDPSYPVTCACAVVRAVQEVTFARCEIENETTEKCEARMEAESQWLCETITALFATT